MATDFERMLFDQELKAVAALSEAQRWVLERDESVPLGIFATMHPKSTPAELYKARLRWTDLTKPASLKFIDLSSGSDTIVEAWPACAGFRPPCLDACVPWTSEGQALHPEWARSQGTAFVPPEAPVRFAVLQVQHLLDNYYSGRGHR